MIDVHPAVIPRPTHMHVGDGRFTLDGQTTISAGPGAEESGELLREYLQVTGLSLPASTSTGVNNIALRLGEPEQELGDEGYHLTAGDTGVTIRAQATAGLRHGIQTLRQLLPPEVYGRRPAPGLHWSVPHVEVTDTPRFGWRGSLLDVGRWYLPLDYLYSYVDVLAMHKINRLHLHLTEDQGWRFEVQQYPELTRVGAWRRESQLGHESQLRHDGIPHGGYYTQVELRDLVAFAERRGIVVVPEIDLPGHVTAAVAAYPELGNVDVSGQIEVSTSWGVHESVLNFEESTLRFFEDVLTEAIEVFPSAWIHIGGDECPTTEWERSPAAQERIRSLGYGDAGQAQLWFTNHMCAFLRKHGRATIVWDEAATDGLDPEAVVMAWRHQDIGVAVAGRGHQVIMTPTQRTYFDWYQSNEPGQPVAHEGVTTLRDVFEYDPSPPSLDRDVAARILGTQGALWGEYLPTPDRVDNMAFPRMCALAERAWSTHDDDYNSFTGRLSTHMRRLAAAGVSPDADAASG